MPKDKNTKLGKYIGPEELFKAKRGVIRSFGEVVKMQFDEGPDWLTQSWLTFPSVDVAIDKIQTLNAESLVIGDEDPLDFSEEDEDDNSN